MAILSANKSPNKKPNPSGSSISNSIRNAIKAAAAASKSANDKGSTSSGADSSGSSSGGKSKSGGTTTSAAPTTGIKTASLSGLSTSGRIGNTYRVEADGNAPQGAKIGDKIVTGGGTYLITGFQDGKPTSKLIDAGQTTVNYRGSYDKPGANLSTVFQSGSGNPSYSNKDTSSGRTYVVNANGQAPSNAQAGDYVVTGNGLYQILSINADGTRNSRLVDPHVNTSNFNQYTGANNSALIGPNGYLLGWADGGTARQIAMDGQPSGDYTGLYGGDISLYSGYQMSAQESAQTTSRLSSHLQGAQASGASALAQEIERVMASGSDAEKSLLLRNLDSFMGVSSTRDYNAYGVGSHLRSDMNAQGVLATGGTNANLSIQDAYAIANGYQNHDQMLRSQSQPSQNYSSGYGGGLLQPEAYTPVNPDDYLGGIMSFDEAVNMARGILEPQYRQLYEQSATQAAQNLDRMGLYDSVYGQALSAEAQREIDRDLQAAVQSLAVQLQGQSREQAMLMLQMAIQESQFGASHNANNVNNMNNWYLKNKELDQNFALRQRELDLQRLNFVLSVVNANRDYELAREAQALKERTQNFYERDADWNRGGFDSYYDLQQALMELEYQLNSKYRSSSSYSGGGVSIPAPPTSNQPSGNNTGGGSLSTGNSGGQSALPPGWSPQQALSQIYNKTVDDFGGYDFSMIYGGRLIDVFIARALEVGISQSDISAFLAGLN